MEKYDVIIIGGGPAGLTAGIYSARYHMKTIIFSKNIGGTASTAHKICNFPSYTNIKGFELMQRFIKHVESLKVPIVYEEVSKIEKKSDNFIVCVGKTKYESKKLIFAGGTERIRLNINGEGKFLGRGVSYCATCDAAFFKNKKIAVVGGSDAALTAALLLTEYSNEVFIIYRKDKFFRAEPAWVELVDKNKNIKKIFNEEITEIIGKEKVEKIKLKSGKTMDVDGVFIEAGSVPETKLLKELKVKLNDKDYIIVDKNQETSVKGLFAAGDVTNNNLKQIVTATGEAAVAANSCYRQIKEENDC